MRLHISVKAAIKYIRRKLPLKSHSIHLMTLGWIYLSIITIRFMLAAAHMRTSYHQALLTRRSRVIRGRRRLLLFVRPHMEASIRTWVVTLATGTLVHEVSHVRGPSRNWAGV